MADVKVHDREPSVSLLYLRDEGLREGMELLYFAYRDFTAEADAILAELGFGRAHHRTLHFIARNQGITIMELLAVLRITKQSLGRVLKDLLEAGLVDRTQGSADRRYKHLALTEKGVVLEKRLSATLKRAIASAYRSAGAEAVSGFRDVLLGLMSADTRALFDRLGEKRNER
jgi:DNA-binding MarR family transcriptional regulator